MTSNHSSRNYSRLRTDAGTVKGGVSWRMFLALAIAVGAALLFVWLRSSVETMNKELQLTRHKLAVRTKEVENLRMQLESYTRDNYILAAVEKYNLGLRPAEQGQVRRIAMSQSRNRQRVEPLSASLLAKRE